MVTMRLPNPAVIPLAATVRPLTGMDRYTSASPESKPPKPPPLRLVEVFDRPVKLRTQAELSSRLIATLDAGTRLKVVETQVTTAGTERIRVAHVNGDKPLGWVTARKSRLGDYLLRDVNGKIGKLSHEKIPHSHRSFPRSASAPPRTRLRQLPTTPEDRLPTSKESIVLGPDLPWLVSAASYRGPSSPQASHRGPPSQRGPPSNRGPPSPPEAGAQGKWPLVFFTSSWTTTMGGESTDRIRVTATLHKGKQLGQVEEGRQKGSASWRSSSHSPSPQRTPQHSQRSPQRSHRNSTSTKLHQQSSEPDRGGEGDNKKGAAGGHKPLERGTSSMKKSKQQEALELPHSSQLEAAARAMMAKAAEVESKIARRTLDVLVSPLAPRHRRTRHLCFSQRAVPSRGHARLRWVRRSGGRQPNTRARPR